MYQNLRTTDFRNAAGFSWSYYAYFTGACGQELC